MGLWQSLVNHLAPTKSPFLKGPITMTEPVFKDIGTPADGDAYVPAHVQREKWLKSQASAAPAVVAPVTTVSATAASTTASPRPITAIQADVSAAAAKVAQGSQQIAAHQAAIATLQADVAAAQNDVQNFGAELRGAVEWAKGELTRAITGAEDFLKAHGL